MLGKLEFIAFSLLFLNGIAFDSRAGELSNRVDAYLQSSNCEEQSTILNQIEENIQEIADWESLDSDDRASLQRLAIRKSKLSNALVEKHEQLSILNTGSVPSFWPMSPDLWREALKGLNFFDLIQVSQASRSFQILASSWVTLLNHLVGDMVLIEGGKTKIGALPEEDQFQVPPAHEVVTEPIHLAKYMVTQEQFVWVMGYNPSEFKKELDCPGNWTALSLRKEGQSIKVPVCKRHPVDSVKFEEVEKFLKKLTTLYRTFGNDDGNTQKIKFILPTAAQFEKATQKPLSSNDPRRMDGFTSEHSLYSGTNDTVDVGRYAWILGYKASRPVGKKLPNERGLYDMTGLFSQITSDVVKAGFLEGHHVTKGGSIFESSPLFLRAARSDVTPACGGYGTNFVTFRIAMIYESSP